ncbi:hypothetical protein P67b_00062 [Ruegeria phage Tedan]|nr:hypothetical protein P67b_00062 [Ruegeria phage Tedan]
MFSKIIARKKEIQDTRKQACGAAQGEWIVKDRFTHQELFRGSKDKCESLLNAFGACYITLS